jgi:hypothetical protein
LDIGLWALDFFFPPAISEYFSKEGIQRTIREREGGCQKENEDYGLRIAEDG